MKSSGKEDILIAKYYNCLQKKAEIIGDCSVCKGGETELSVSGNFSSFFWNNKEWGEKQLVVNEPGIYHVTAFDKQGCASSDTVVIETLKIPDLGLPSEIEMFPGDKVFISPENGFSFYLWEDGSQTAEREVGYMPGMDSLILSLTAETFEGCTVIDSTIVRFNHENKQLPFSDSNIKTWPNPVNTKLSWYVKTHSEDNITVTLTDIKSVVVFKHEYSNYIPNAIKTIDMADLASGNYLFNITAGEIIYNQKVIKK